MKNIQYKSNIKCGACVAAVKPGLDAVVGEGRWKVDLNTKDRILSVDTEQEEKVEEVVQKAGYQLERI